MQPHYIVLAAIAATSLYAVAAPSAPLPAPWMLSGKTPAAYEAGIDQSVTGDTKGAKFIRYTNGDDKTWATLMQQFGADDYRGKRIRFRASIKTAGVSQWAGLWMRVDTAARHNASFYNSQDQPITGTSNWQVREVVLDVPADANAISFGVIQGGTGQVWIDRLQLAAVDGSVPLSVQPQLAVTNKPSL